MTLEELNQYFLTLDLAERAIGFQRSNRKHLFRLERLKELLFDAFFTMTPNDFVKECSVDEFEKYVSDHENLSRVYDREDWCKCRVPGRPTLYSKARGNILESETGDREVFAGHQDSGSDSKQEPAFDIVA